MLTRPIPLALSNPDAHRKIKIRELAIQIFIAGCKRDREIIRTNDAFKYATELIDFEIDK